MDMAEDVVARLDSALYGSQQLYAARTDARAAQVPVAHRWRVRHQYIRRVRDLPPLAEARLAAGQVERPLAELRLPWSPIEVQTVNVNCLVLQVSAVCQALFYVLHFHCLRNVVLRQSQGGNLVDDAAPPRPVTGGVAQWVGESSVKTQLMIPSYYDFVFVRKTSLLGLTFSLGIETCILITF